MSPRTPEELLIFRTCVREFRQAQKQQRATQIRDLRLQGSDSLIGRLNPVKNTSSTTKVSSSNNSPTINDSPSSGR